MLNFKSDILKKPRKTGYFQIIASAVWFTVFQKFGTFVEWPFFVLLNKSARICLNTFGDTVIQSLKSGKTRKNAPVPMSKKEKLAALFLLFPARLET